MNGRSSTLLPFESWRTCRLGVVAAVAPISCAALRVAVSVSAMLLEETPGDEAVANRQRRDRDGSLSVGSPDESAVVEHVGIGDRATGSVDDEDG